MSTDNLLLLVLFSAWFLLIVAGGVWGVIQLRSGTRRAAKLWDQASRKSY